AVRQRFGCCCSRCIGCAERLKTFKPSATEDTESTENPKDQNLKNCCFVFRFSLCPLCPLWLKAFDLELMNIPFKTRITDLYGTRLPVIASGLMWLAEPVYVAAVARAGLIGFMTSASFPDPAALRAGIRKCRELSAGKPFGVNIMIRVSRDGSDRVTPL